MREHVIDRGGHGCVSCGVSRESPLWYKSCPRQSDSFRWNEHHRQYANEKFLLHALEYSNAADDLTYMDLSAFTFGITARGESFQRLIELQCRHADRIDALAVAAFICWASGGAYAIRREP